MEEQFRELKSFYDNNDFDKIFSNKLGFYFLKLKSISRTALLRELANNLNINVDGIKGSNNLFKYLFCKSIGINQIDNFINQIYDTERSERKKIENDLYSQLYKLRDFYWGGFYQNAVEQTIINNYVKRIHNFDQLLLSIENNINPRLRGYILCSWYNHWTSILIEDMIKDHEDILPTVGLVKKVDFFWQNFPFDLKVTYFPAGFMKEKRKEKNLKPELTELKAFAKKYNVHYDKTQNDKEVFDELLLKISECNYNDAKMFIEDFHKIRHEIIIETINNPKQLIKWFYENQGTRRFDAANRFFIVLIDKNRLEDSWKLKRNKEMLNDNINEYFNKNKNKDFIENKIIFQWEDKEYQTIAIYLFIIKD